MSLIEFFGIVLFGFSISGLSQTLATVYLGRNFVEPIFLIALIITLRCNPLLVHLLRVALRRPLSVFMICSLGLFGLIGLLTGLANGLGLIEVGIGVYGDFRACIVILLFVIIALERTIPVLVIETLVTRTFVTVTVFDCLALGLYGGGGAGDDWRAAKSSATLAGLWIDGLEENIELRRGAGEEAMLPPRPDRPRRWPDWVQGRR